MKVIYATASPMSLAVLPSDTLVMVGGCLDITDIVSLMIVSRRFNVIFKSNSVWRDIYQRIFPRKAIGPNSVHHSGGQGDCEGKEGRCTQILHYNNLKVVTEPIRKYSNFRQQYMKRLMTIDKRMIRNYIYLPIPVLNKRIGDVESQMRLKRKQLKNMEDQLQRLVRTKRIKTIGFDVLYAYNCVHEKEDLNNVD